MREQETTPQLTCSRIGFGGYRVDDARAEGELHTRDHSGTGPVRCTGTVVHPGRTVVTTEARLEDREGRLLAHATSTILVLRD